MVGVGEGAVAGEDCGEFAPSCGDGGDLIPSSALIGQRRYGERQLGTGSILKTCHAPALVDRFEWNMVRSVGMEVAVRGGDEGWGRLIRSKRLVGCRYVQNSSLSISTSTVGG